MFADRRDTLPPGAGPAGARLVPGVEDRAGLPLYRAAGGDVNRARAAWAFAHGMIMLELTNRLPPAADIEAAWREGIDAFRPG